MLEEGNIAYPNGKYAVGFEDTELVGSPLVVHHQIEGAPLISRLLDEGSARYVCAVSSPRSAYREMYISETSPQTVRWSEDDLGEPPLFTPMILCSKEETVDHF